MNTTAPATYTDADLWAMSNDEAKAAYSALADAGHQAEATRFEVRYEAIQAQAAIDAGDTVERLYCDEAQGCSRAAGHLGGHVLPAGDLLAWQQANTYALPRTQLRVQDGSVSVEASTIGLRPGQWPAYLTTTSRSGAQVVFSLKGLKRDAEGDVQFAHYTAAQGTLVLTVWND